MTTISPETGGAVGLWCDPAALAQDERLKDVRLPDGITFTDIVASTSRKLYRASGHRWMGRQTITVRPHRLTRSCSCGSALMTFATWGGGDIGSWFNRLFPESGLALRLSEEIDLGPNVISVDQVMVDGQILAADGTEYVLFGNRTLVRTDDANGGRRYWPCCQRIATPVTEVGTWQVTYTAGQMPPPDGRMAAYAWSLERARRFDTRNAAVPGRASKATSQNLEITIEDNASLDAGRVGIPEVDEFLESVNPARTVRRAEVYDPDSIVLGTVERQQ